MTASIDEPLKKIGNEEDRAYELFLRAFDEAASKAAGAGPLFRTDAEGLWGAYLSTFEGAARQLEDCSACRGFVERYGGLVSLGEDGAAVPVMWDEAAALGPYAAAFAAARTIVRRAKVTGVFLSSATVLGRPKTGVWRHLSLSWPRLFKHALQTAGQAMSEKQQDFTTVLRALDGYSKGTVEQALSLLKTEALYRSEKVLGQAQWLSDLHAARDAVKGDDRKHNVLWLAVAKAPAGFCHPRASMIGTLLDDIAAGLAFDEVSRRFAAKMHPLQYQRPQAAPSAGNIAQAEKIIAELGAAGALARRYARLDEIKALWLSPAEAQPSGGGVFAHLIPKTAKSEPSIDAPTQKITWEKFARTVLPSAKAIEVRAPDRGDYVGVVTAQDADAVPILQWDLPERRNPFSVYMWIGGSTATSWGLASGAWTRVNAVCLRPHLWHGDDFAHQGKGAILVLDGAKDSRWASAGAVLFPEMLKSELRAIRSTIEAYSKGAHLGGLDEASANGLYVGKEGLKSDVRVTATNGTRATWLIDRWD